MKIFAVDTCCMAATAAVMDDCRLVAETVVNHRKTHSQKMMPQIEAILSQAEVDISDIDYFAAAVGPGSFTGVRIGVATVKSMAQAAGKECVAVSTLEALANASRVFPGILCPILDARRDQVYNALFSGGESFLRLCPDRALALSDLLYELEKRPEPVLFMGDGTLVYREEIATRLGRRAQFAQRMLNMNLASSVCEVAFEKVQQGEVLPYGELVPAYVRLSQAERDLKKKMENGVEK